MAKLIFVGTIFSGNPRSALQRAKSGDWLTHHITNEVVQLCHGMPLLEPIPHPSSSIPALLRRFHLWTNLGGNLDSRSCSRWCSQGICLGATIVSCQGIRDQDTNSCTYRLVMIGSLRFFGTCRGLPAGILEFGIRPPMATWNSVKSGCCWSTAQPWGWHIILVPVNPCPKGSRCVDYGSLGHGAAAWSNIAMEYDETWHGMVMFYVSCTTYTLSIVYDHVEVPEGNCSPKFVFHEHGLSSTSSTWWTLGTFCHGVQVMPGYELNMGHQVGCLAGQGQGRSKCFEIEMPALIFKNNLCKGISPQNMALYGTVPLF